MDNSIYRIIDANFNRAREACRMMEEYCRFKLNSSFLTDRTKTIRHKICDIINSIDPGKLLANRNTSGDVGAAKRIDGQLDRSDLQDCFTAACKRLTEALRVLTEMLAPFNKLNSQQMEKLRFQAYDLEKDIVLFADSSAKFDRVRLYVIITRDLPVNIINLTNQCIAGGADCIQLRAKQMPGDELYLVAEEVVRLCRRANVLSIINDRIDIALAADADGVHLGQNDLPVGKAKKLSGSPIIIGKSTHDLAQLENAIAEVPAYVGLGPVFATETKPDAEVSGLEYVNEAVSVLNGSGIKHVAIGGITIENASQVLKAGANVLAVCSAVTEAQDPAKACRLFKERISENFD